MKLAPIRNPHSKTSKQEKLSKREEKTLLINKVKEEAFHKYGKKRQLKKPIGGLTTGGMGATKRK